MTQIKARYRKKKLINAKTYNQPVFDKKLRVILDKRLCDLAMYTRRHNLPVKELEKLLSARIILSPLSDISKININCIGKYTRRLNLPIKELEKLLDAKVMLSPLDKGHITRLSGQRHFNLLDQGRIIQLSGQVQMMPNRPFRNFTINKIDARAAGTSNGINAARSSNLNNSQSQFSNGIISQQVFSESNSISHQLPLSNNNEAVNLSTTDQQVLTPILPVLLDDEDHIILARNTNQETYRAAFVTNAIFPENEFPVHRLLLLQMSNICTNCQASYFNEERAYRTNLSSLCCQRGKLQLDEFGDCPPELNSLLTANTINARHYREHIRHYNSSCAFASTVGNYQVMGAGPHVIKVNGVIHHIMPQVIPQAGRDPKFGQLYYMDTQDGQIMRALHSDPCKADILREIDVMLRRVNPFPAVYRMLRDVYEEEVERCAVTEITLPEVVLAIAPNMNTRLDPNRFNVPAINEIAAVFVGDEPPFAVDIQLYPRNGVPQTIRDMSPFIDPLSYPLLFPHGERGWSNTIRHTGVNATDRYNMVTCREYVAYRLAIRMDNFSILHYSGKLFMQWIVDSWCRIEGLNLQYIRTHQRQLHVENYNVLQEYVANQASDAGLRVGKIFVLPSTFIGSPRYMHQRYLDAMKIVAVHGKPDLFLTFTCNPTWPDIVDNLFPGQEAMNRPDLVCRVFKIKLDHLIDLILNKHYFGKVKSLLYVVEFQKRGLPHAHILIILDRIDKILVPEHVDQIIRAELPHPRLEPHLFELVTRHMIHRKCGAGKPGITCQRNGHCRYHYPKSFNRETIIGNSTYAQYSRREDGRTYTVNLNVYDNRDVVPYSPVLLSMFEAHLNIEVCASISATKYLYKYVYKGHDGILIDVQEGLRNQNGAFDWDEIERYQECRYVSAHEAYWRIAAFPLSYCNMSVFMLAIHLPEQQNVYFDGIDVAGAVRKAADQFTHLTAWFHLNETDVNAQRHLYVDVVKNYSWQRQRHVWTVRRSHFNVIGRLPDVSPNRGDLFYLRLLLGAVSGVTSFEHLRTVHGQIYPTFRQACLARNLISDDREFLRCMQEAAVHMMPKNLRLLFAHILIHCNPQEPLALWDRFSDDMIEDFVHSLKCDYQDAINLALLHIDNVLQQNNKSTHDFLLPEPNRNAVHANQVIVSLDNLDADEHADLAVQLQATLNASQMAVFNETMDNVHRLICGDTNSKKILFVDGPAGTGKTYLYNCLLHTIWGMGMNPVAVAFTGIAAVLLEGGRTSHAQFGLPINCVEDSTSLLRFHDKRALELLNAPLIVWDEASMISRFSLECADRFLRSLMNNPNVPFGGKIVVVGGDFRQLLPVVRRGRRIDVVNRTIKSSLLWPEFSYFQLQQNMRANPAQRLFAIQLLEYGEGRHLRVNGLSDEYFRVDDALIIQREQIISTVFGNDIAITGKENRAVLTPTNLEAEKFNTKVLSLLPNAERRYISVDTLIDHDQQAFYVPMDLLNAQTPPGCPPHVLALKVNAVVMLLRNIDLSAGLCNGTRLIIRNMDDHVLTTEILTGTRLGAICYIPRMDLICDPANTDLPFKFNRRQFPIRLAYAMTINKSQGQTLDKVALYLPSPVFAHGQLYVAMSRTRQPDDLKICIVEGVTQGSMNQQIGTFTKNIIFEEVL